MPLISVVIPFTHYENEFRGAIDSVLGQDFDDFEIVLIGNNASDKAITIAEEYCTRYPKKLKMYYETVQGLPSARNLGILKSEGTYISLFDSDDLMKPQQLSTLLSTFQKVEAEGVSLLGAWNDDISSDGKSLLRKGGPIKPSRWAQYIYSHTTKYRKNPLIEPRPSTMFFRKTTAMDIGLFDTRYNPFWLEDTHFVFKMYEKGKIHIIQEALCLYRLHQKSDSERRNLDFRQIKNTALFFSDLKTHFKDSKDARLKKGLERVRSRFLRETGMKLLCYRQGKEIGKRFIRKAFKSDPMNVKNLETTFRIFLPNRYHPNAFGINQQFDDDLPDFLKEETVDSLFD